MNYRVIGYDFGVADGSWAVRTEVGPGGVVSCRRCEVPVPLFAAPEPTPDAPVKPLVKKRRRT